MGNVPLCHRTFAHSWVRGWFCGSRKFTSLYKLLGSGKVIQQWFHGGKTKPTGIHFVFLVPRTSHSERNCHLSIPDMVQGSELMTCLHFAWNLGKCETQRESSCSKYWFAKEVEGVGQNLLAPLLLPLSPLPPPSFQLLLPGQGETVTWPQGPQSQGFYHHGSQWSLATMPAGHLTSFNPARGRQDVLVKAQVLKAIHLGLNTTLIKLLNPRLSFHTCKIGMIISTSLCRKTK